MAPAFNQRPPRSGSGSQGNVIDLSERRRASPPAPLPSTPFGCVLPFSLNASSALIVYDSSIQRDRVKARSLRRPTPLPRVIKPAIKPVDPSKVDARYAAIFVEEAKRRKTDGVIFISHTRAQAQFERLARLLKQAQPEIFIIFMVDDVHVFASEGTCDFADVFIGKNSPVVIQRNR